MLSWILFKVLSKIGFRHSSLAVIAFSAGWHNVFGGVSSTARDWYLMLLIKRDILYSAISARIIVLGQNVKPLIGGQRMFKTFNPGSSVMLVFLVNLWIVFSLLTCLNSLFGLMPFTEFSHVCFVFIGLSTLNSANFYFINMSFGILGSANLYLIFVRLVICFVGLFLSLFFFFADSPIVSFLFSPFNLIACRAKTFGMMSLKAFAFRAHYKIDFVFGKSRYGVAPMT